MAARQASHDTNVRAGVLLLLYHQAFFSPASSSGTCNANVFNVWQVFEHELEGMKGPMNEFHLLMSHQEPLANSPSDKSLFFYFRLVVLHQFWLLVQFVDKALLFSTNVHVTFNFSDALPFAFVSVNSQQQHAPTQPHKPLIYPFLVIW